jgi:hypothetical protein
MASGVSAAVKHIRQVLDTRPLVMGDIVVEVRGNIDDSGVCEEGMRGCWNLLFFDATEKKRAFDAELIQLCLDVLMRHARHVYLGRSITRNCLFIIKEMAATCGSTSKKIKETHKKLIFDRTQAMGLSKVVIDNMKLYSGNVVMDVRANKNFRLDSKVQEAGCAALGWLNLRASKDYRAKVIAYGALDRIEFCIMNFPRNPHVLRYARWVHEMLMEAKAEYERDMLTKRETEERQKMIDRMARNVIAQKKDKKKKKSQFDENEDE